MKRGYGGQTVNIAGGLFAVYRCAMKLESSSDGMEPLLTSKIASGLSKPFGKARSGGDPSLRIRLSALALTDMNGRFLATNHVYQTIVGYTEEELRALQFLDLTHEDYRESNWALITELLEGKRRQFQIEKKYLRKGRQFGLGKQQRFSCAGHREGSTVCDGAVRGHLTAQRAEEALRRSEAYLAEAQKLTHTGSWVWNVRTDTLLWSQEVFRIYDYDPEKMAHHTWDFFERVHPEDRPKLEQRKRRMQSTQEGCGQILR